MYDLLINVCIVLLVYAIVSNVLMLYFIVKVLSRLSDVLLSLEAFLDRH